MSITTPTPPPRFARLISRPFKKEIFKKEPAPTSRYMADIYRDQASWTTPKPTPTPAKTTKKKSNNAFLKALKKVVPCASGKYHDEELDVPVVVDTVYSDVKSTKSRTSPVLGGPAKNNNGGSQTSLQGTGVDAPILNVNESPIPRTSPQGNRHSPSLKELADPALSQAGDSSRPSSLSSVPSSILGESSPRLGQDGQDVPPVSEELPVNAEPQPAADPVSLLQIMETLSQAIDGLLELKRKNPAVSEYLISRPPEVAEMETLFNTVFPETLFQSESTYDHIGSKEKDVIVPSEALIPSASEDSLSVYSATPPDSILDRIESGDNTPPPQGNVHNLPDIMLSLPTESDFGGIQEVEEEVPAPELLSTQWMPTPEPYKRLSREAGRRTVRRMTSAPDMLWMASGFDSDSDDEDEVTPKALEPLPLDFLPSREALAARRRQAPAESVGVPKEVVVEESVVSGTDTTADSSANDNKSSDLSPTDVVLVAEIARGQDTAPPSSTHDTSVDNSVPVPKPQPEVPPSQDTPTPTPTHDEGRRIPLRRGSKPYNRMSGVWGDHVVLKPDFTNFPTRDEAIRAERRRSSAILPDPASSKRGSMGYIKRQTGIRPLVLPARVAMRESREYGSSSGYASSSRLSGASESSWTGSSIRGGRETVANAGAVGADTGLTANTLNSNNVSSKLDDAVQLPLSRSVLAPTSPRYGYF